MTATAPYPEHEKLAAVRGLSQAVGEFLEWAEQVHGAVLAQYRDTELWGTPGMGPITIPVERLLAEHFGIDLDAIEAEKRAMLKALAS